MKLSLRKNRLKIILKKRWFLNYLRCIIYVYDSSDFLKMTVMFDERCIKRYYIKLLKQYIIYKLTIKNN